MSEITMKEGIKAQFWSFDALFAIMIFSVAVTILALTWLNISNELSLSSSNQGFIMQLQAQDVAQSLVSPGSPANWQSTINLTNPSSWIDDGVGLGSSQGSSLSTTKLYALQSMVSYNYSAAGPALGTEFNYYITMNGGPFNVTMGDNPTTNNAVTTFLSRKSGVINGVPVKIVVYIWSSSVSSAS